MKKSFFFAILFMFFSFSSLSHAEFHLAKVTAVEMASFSPSGADSNEGGLIVGIDKAFPRPLCGKSDRYNLYFDMSIERNKQMYPLLIASYLTGKEVRFDVNTHSRASACGPFGIPTVRGVRAR